MVINGIPLCLFVRVVYLFYVPCVVKNNIEYDVINIHCFDAPISSDHRVRSLIFPLDIVLLMFSIYIYGSDTKYSQAAILISCVIPFNVQRQALLLYHFPPLQIVTFIGEPFYLIILFLIFSLYVWYIYKVLAK